MMEPESAFETALGHIRNGNLDRAEKALHEAVRGGANPAAGRALERVGAMKVLFLLSTGQIRDAHRLAAHYLVHFPHSAVLMGAFLSLSSEREAIPGPAGHGRLVLGAGTGRSGSTSLTLLLQAQDDVYFSHEHPPQLNWSTADARFEFHLQRYKSLARSFRAFGDVSHWWLPRLGAVLAAFPDARCIILKRDLEETIASFLRIKGGEGKGAINHWVAHDGAFWRRNIWDECYPKFDLPGTRQAIAAYWSAYYEQSEVLQSKYPENVRVFALPMLSSEAGQAEMLEFAGFGQGRTIRDLVANQNTIKDGAGLVPPIV